MNTTLKDVGELLKDKAPRRGFKIDDNSLREVLNALLDNSPTINKNIIKAFLCNLREIVSLSNRVATVEEIITTLQEQQHGKKIIRTTPAVRKNTGRN